MSGGITEDGLLTRRIAALVDRFGLGPGAAEQLTRLLAIVVADPLAPTTVRTPSAVLDDHLADSLVALELPEVRAATAIADLGSGAGFPGLPLAIALPSARVNLVDSARRKCAFASRAIAAVRATNATVVCRRAEAWPEALGRFDLVTARALAAPAVVAEYAAPLLTDGGALVAWLGRIDSVTDRATAAAAVELGLELRPPIAVRPYPSARDRHLQVLVKVAPTPQRFPRRPGMARKRPLAR